MRPRVDIDPSLVTAGLAGRRQPAHTTFPHVPERHGPNVFVGPSHWLAVLLASRRRTDGAGGFFFVSVRSSLLRSPSSRNRPFRWGFVT
jgi:hypothetical protein